MEYFSQSRGEDDLFDDEIVPYEPAPQEALVQSVPLQPSTTAPAPSRKDDSRRGSRGRGQRNAAREASKQNELLDSRWATPAAPAPVAKAASPPAQEQSDPSAKVPKAPPENDGTPVSAPPEAQATQTTARPAAVRGDRTGTGGVKKPKLTEAELTAKLLAAKERSTTLNAAHARAQADAASFEERERVAQQKRAKEKVERRVMDNERQKNAARKAAAMGGREWDLEKNEEDFRVQRGRGDPRRHAGQIRTMNGATADRSNPGLDDLSQYQWHEGRGAGRGARGRGRGGPRSGRGDAPSGANLPNVKAETEFPVLPNSTQAEAKNQPSRPDPAKKIPEVLSPGLAKSSWADQMDESEVVKA